MRSFVLVLSTLALLAQSAPARAQGSAGSPVTPVSDGDGRVHGGPVLPVSQQELKPGQVHTITLHPRYHTVLEFPFPIVRIDAGDPDVFAASIVGNKISLKATKVTKSETSMSIIMGDADGTVVPFIVRADSTQPTAYVVRYTDPVAQHLNAAEAEIAKRLTSEQDRRVSDLTELRLQQRLLLAGDVVRINKTAETGHAGERLRVVIESAQQLPGDDGRPRLYIRYRVANGTVAALNDLYFSLSVTRTDRRMLVFSRTSAHDVYDVQDVRTATSVPAGGSVVGLLILDDMPVKSSRERLNVTAIAFNGQRKVRVEGVLTGQP